MIADKLRDRISDRFEGIRAIGEDRSFGMLDKIDDLKGEILSGDIFGHDLDELDNYIYEKIFGLLHRILDDHPAIDRVTEIVETVVTKIDNKTDEIEDRVKGRMKERLDDIWLPDDDKHHIGYIRDALTRHKRRWQHRIGIVKGGFDGILDRIG